MAVVPGNELRCRPRARQVLAGNAHPAIGLRTVGVDHRVVEHGQLVVRDVPPHVDVAEEPKPGPLRDLLEGARDGLDLRMIGRNTETDEPPRSGQPIEHVDLDRRVVSEQCTRGVEACGARPDDRDAVGMFEGHGVRIMGGT